MPINDYCTVSDIKEYLPDFGWTGVSTYDSLITKQITATSRAVDLFTNREPGAYYVTTDDTRYFDGPDYGPYANYQGGNENRASGGMLQFRSLEVDEMADVPTSVSVTPDGNTNNYQLWATPDSNSQPTYWMYPYNAKSKRKPYTRIDLNVLYGQHSIWYTFPRAVKIVGPFGYSRTVPEDLADKVKTQVCRVFLMAQKNLQQEGTLGNLQAPVKMFIKSTLDTDLQKEIMRYRKQAV